VPAGFGLSGKKEDDRSILFFLICRFGIQVPLLQCPCQTALLRVKELAGLDKISTWEVESPFSLNYCY